MRCSVINAVSAAGDAFFPDAIDRLNVSRDEFSYAVIVSSLKDVILKDFSEKDLQGEKKKNPLKVFLHLISDSFISSPAKVHTTRDLLIQTGVKF